MKKIILSVMLILMFLPAYLSAQSWSSDQKEVWSAIEGWWNNAKAHNSAKLDATIHKDYKGWSLDEAYPSSKNDLSFWVNNLLLKRKTLPITI